MLRTLGTTFYVFHLILGLFNICRLFFNFIIEMRKEHNQDDNDRKNGSS